MEAGNFFTDDKGHLRSGWRVTFFGIAFLVCFKLLAVVSLLLTALIFKEPLSGNAGFVINAGVLLASATLVGWACGVLFEEIPFSALGWSRHQGWWRNLAIGSGLGAGSLVLAVALATATRGFHFGFGSLGAAPIAKTLATSAFVFVFGAAAEEALFRGYPLQTLTRANLTWLGVLLTSASFALVHFDNPNVARGFTLINTALAGVWLAVAYLRTRSLWFPLGLHWSWNWMQASILGLPVSGITRIAPVPLLHTSNAGPDWLTGGAYGIEGGAACTVALLVSILVVWRTKLVSRADVPNQRPAHDTLPVRAD